MEETKEKVTFDYYDLENNLASERVWVQQEGKYYRIKNIPFFIPNIAYDDLISVEIDDGELFFDDIIEESGNSTIQIVIFDATNIETITKKIESFNCGWEGSHLQGYISVNVPKEVNYRFLKNFLQESAKELDYKEACLVHEL